MCHCVLRLIVALWLEIAAKDTCPAGLGVELCSWLERELLLHFAHGRLADVLRKHKASAPGRKPSDVNRSS